MCASYNTIIRPEIQFLCVLIDLSSYMCMPIAALSTMVIPECVIARWFSENTKLLVTVEKNDSKCRLILNHTFQIFFICIYASLMLQCYFCGYGGIVFW